jgi:serine/threonine protein kinase
MDERTHVPGEAAGDSTGDTGQRKVFGPYRIVGRLGEGGMSVVWEAVHPTRGRNEALKVLHAHLCRDAQVAERFHREVRAMSGLSHDHVVPVYDAGDVDGELYYTMPSLDGPTLAGLLEKVRATGEPVPGAAANAVLDELGLPASPVPSEPPTVQYARRIAGALIGVTDALGAMHAEGLLHRDVKPSNLMFDGRGRLVIADFGLVRTEDQRITATDEWLGTPAYMSPEQIVPKDTTVDGRTDIYSLGATLYELLTLDLPHQGATVAETLSLVIARRARSIRDVNPALPRDLETIVARCLETRPDDRYPDAPRLVGDLAAFARGAGIATKPVAPSKRLARAATRHWKPIAAGALVVLAAVGLWLTRGAHLSVRALPEGGRVVIDGEDVGTFPLERYALSAGEHDVLLEPEDERFKPLALRVSLDRGDHRDLERILPAKNPADADVLTLLASLADVEQTRLKGPVTAMRGVSPLRVAAPAPLWPRGDYQDAPRSVILETVKDHLGAVVRLMPAGRPGAEPAQTWTVGSHQGEVSLPIDDDTLEAMTPGTAWHVEVLDAEGAKRDEMSFSLVDGPYAASLEADLERLARRFGPGDPAATLILAEHMLSEGLVGSAYELAQAAHDQLGPRREIARIALTALDHAGLRNRGPWSRWVKVHKTAKD